MSRRLMEMGYKALRERVQMPIPTPDITGETRPPDYINSKVLDYQIKRFRDGVTRPSLRGGRGGTSDFQDLLRSKRLKSYDREIGNFFNRGSTSKTLKKIGN